MKTGSRRRGERGQGLLELALVTPLLLLLCMSIVDLGRLLFVYVAIEEAAQEGALYGANVPGVEMDIIDRVKSSSLAPEVADADVDVACPGPVAGTIRVEVTYPVPLITPFVGQLFGGTWTVGTDVIANIVSGSCP